MSELAQKEKKNSTLTHKISNQEKELSEYKSEFSKYKSEMKKLEKSQNEIVSELKTKLKHLENSLQASNKIKEEQNAILTTCGETSFENNKNVKKEVEDQGTNTESKYACKKCNVSLELAYMLDCGHLPFCANCSNSITLDDNPRCPICKKSVAYKQRALIEEAF